jgi:cob(I)alamin adenosyltransferase
MSEKSIKYSVKLEVTEDANVEEIERCMEEVLIDLYDQGDVLSIGVTKDGYSSDDKDIEELLSLLDRFNSSDIRSAIDIVEKMDDEG